MTLLCFEKHDIGKKERSQSIRIDRDSFFSRCQLEKINISFSVNKFFHH